MDLTTDQIASLVAWAEETPAVLELYVFGSRAKGTSRADSDLDIAIVIATVDGLTNKNSFDQHWLEWPSEFEERLGLVVDLLRLHATETPVTHGAVAGAGILLLRAVVCKARRACGSGARRVRTGMLALLPASQGRLK